MKKKQNTKNSPTPRPSLFPPAPTTEPYISSPSPATAFICPLTRSAILLLLSNISAMSVSRVSLLVVVALLYMHCCHTATIPRNFDPRFSDEMVLTPKKRPFCNAFTGCGRKRSQAAPGMPSQELIRPKQISRDINPELSDETVLTPKKRPFCNVFNGCSGSPKRSQASLEMPPEQLVAQKRYLDDDTFGSAPDSEVAIEELFRKILTETQMWDTIREATAKAARRNQKNF